MAMAAGALLDIGGTALLGHEADARRSEYEAAMDKWLPTPDQYESTYFKDLQTYEPQATKLAASLNQEAMNEAMARREQALPGFNESITQSAPQIYSLMAGQVPQSVMSAFQRAGGAGTVGMGFGGSQFGALNTGLYGARGALGAMQTGYGLMQSLLSTMPQINSVSGLQLLNQGVLNPQQRSQLQLQVRQQNIGMENFLMGMPTQNQVWGTSMKQAGSMLMGGGFGGGGGGMSTSGMSSGGLSGGGAAGGWDGSSWASEMA